MPPLPGNPDAVLAAAEALHTASGLLRETRDAVATHGRTVPHAWTGLAAPLALARVERDAHAVEAAVEACEKATVPLRTFADELHRAQHDWAYGERMVAEGQAAHDGVGSGAPVGADVVREQAVDTVTDGTNIMLAAEERVRAANEAAAKELEAATALLASITPPASPPPVVGSDGTLGDGLLKAAGDVGSEVMSLLGGALAHVNVFSDDFGATWKNTWDTTTTAVTHPVEAGKAMVQGTLAPLGDSYRSGGVDEAVGRSPGVIAGALGGKGLTKLGKLGEAGTITELDVGPRVPLAPGGGLRRHENAGGHTLAPDRAHVGATDQELIDRQSASKTSLSATSTFYDRASAERSVSENIDANRKEISTWLGDRNAPSARFDHEHGSPTGRFAPGGTTKLDDVADVSGSRIILRRDSSIPEGYRVQTSFPRP